MPFSFPELPKDVPLVSGRVSMSILAKGDPRVFLHQCSLEFTIPVQPGLQRLLTLGVP